MLGYLSVALVGLAWSVGADQDGCGYVYIVDDDALVTLGQCQVLRDQEQDTRKVRKFRCDSSGVLRLDEWEEAVAELNAKKDCRASDLATRTTAGIDVSSDYDFNCGTQAVDDVCNGIKWERKMWYSNDCTHVDGVRKAHEFRFALDVCGAYNGKGHKWLCSNDPMCNYNSVDNCISTVEYFEYANTDCAGTGTPTLLRTEDQTPYSNPPVCVNGRSLDVDCPMAWKPIDP